MFNAIVFKAGVNPKKQNSSSFMLNFASLSGMALIYTKKINYLQKAPPQHLPVTVNAA